MDDAQLLMLEEGHFGKRLASIKTRDDDEAGPNADNLITTFYDQNPFKKNNSKSHNHVFLYDLNTQIN